MWTAEFTAIEQGAGFRDQVTSSLGLELIASPSFDA
jgi:hypothetical protein